MATWYWYLGPNNSGRWSMQPPYVVREAYVASIDRDEMPDKTPMEMQAEQASAMARMWNPYQG